MGRAGQRVGGRHAGPTAGGHPVRRVLTEDEGRDCGVVRGAIFPSDMLQYKKVQASPAVITDVAIYRERLLRSPNQWHFCCNVQKDAFN